MWTDFIKFLDIILGNPTEDLTQFHYMIKLIREIVLTSFYAVELVCNFLV